MAAETQTNEYLEEAITTSLINGRLPCTVAWDVASRLKVSRSQVGEKLDELGLRVADCQLGCFKVKKATHADLAGRPMNDTLVKAVEAALVDNHLSCPEAFKIAAKYNAAPKAVGDAATQLKVKIAHCQLGCF